MQALSFAVHVPLVAFGISFPVMVCSSSGSTCAPATGSTCKLRRSLGRPGWDASFRRGAPSHPVCALPQESEVLPLRRSFPSDEGLANPVRRDQAFPSAARASIHRGVVCREPQAPALVAVRSLCALPSVWVCARYRPGAGRRDAVVLESPDPAGRRGRLPLAANRLVGRGMRCRPSLRRSQRCATGHHVGRGASGRA
jgi:hypothetical protein